MAGQQRSQRMADGADALHIGGTGQRLRLLVREGAGALRVFLHKEGGCQQAVQLSAEVGVGAAAALLVLVSFSEATTPSFAGESKKALASSIERSEKKTKNLAMVRS